MRTTAIKSVPALDSLRRSRLQPAVLLLLSSLLILAVGCQSVSEGPSTAVQNGAFTTADGLDIAYDVRGRGQTTLVFVHCWSCDRSFWREQLDGFARDYRVVAVDLAGHGASGTARQHWTIQSLADDLRGLVEHLQLKRAVLIGHSMGGPVSLFATRGLPGRVIGVVGVDTLHNAEFKWPASEAQEFVTRFTADFPGTMTAAIRSMFPESADPAVLDWVTSKALAANQQAAIALLRDIASLDLREAFAAVKVPIRCVNSAPQGERGFPTALDLNKKYADYDAVLMEGVGHYPMLERPAEFNTHLRTALQEITARAR